MGSNLPMHASILIPALRESCYRLPLQSLLTNVRHVGPVSAQKSSRTSVLMEIILEGLYLLQLTLLSTISTGGMSTMGALVFIPGIIQMLNARPLPGTHTMTCAQRSSKATFTVRLASDGLSMTLALTLICSLARDWRPQVPKACRCRFRQHTQICQGTSRVRPH